MFISEVIKAQSPAAFGERDGSGLLFSSPLLYANTHSGKRNTA